MPTPAISTKKGTTESSKNDTNVDVREALFNDGKSGCIEQIQVSTECIVRLRGIMFDLDPPLYRQSPLLPEVPQDAQQFYDRVVSQWLSRHPVLDKAEVRCTGQGLHVLLWFDSPIEIQSDSERERWAANVEIVQAALPVDPYQPGITAVTRAVGSVNSKNGQQVVQLKVGTPVSPAEVEALCEQLVKKPFETVLSIVYGQTKISPCPFCRTGKELNALSNIGRCYGCGKHTLTDLYKLLLLDGKEVANDHGRAA